jgi:hypothetical protein
MVISGYIIVQMVLCYRGNYFIYTGKQIVKEFDLL